MGPRGHSRLVVLSPVFPVISIDISLDTFPPLIATVLGKSIPWRAPASQTRGTKHVVESLVGEQVLPENKRKHAPEMIQRTARVVEPITTL
jgi:hypothetical protein